MASCAPPVPLNGLDVAHQLTCSTGVFFAMAMIFLGGMLTLDNSASRTALWVLSGWLCNTSDPKCFSSSQCASAHLLH
ncbi:hypothetical protein DUNSADRAFT_17122 [Dunaliella salina]|uniref:Uncharacterized protein n=1 Tax=Dunaliella salina TaxID=3046 RepID=A0ABQ7G2B5_DUNSA|nr:hypothetical protein DUNSADRAFT_17122 [Dunaliella salina]|eukprot:KAF5828744.1 hypothetical protein DUNSADRAFT_17122 [Dunaliella salina]